MAADNPRTMLTFHVLRLRTSDTATAIATVVIKLKENAMKVRMKKQKAISVLAVFSVLIFYVPAAEAVGIVTTTFTYNAIVEIVLNQPPVAADDFVITTMGTAVEFNILANDTDPDGDLLFITNHVDPIHGELICDYGDGQCEYTPDEGFVGTDSFDYEVSDGLSSATATVTINVIVDKIEVAVDIKPESCPNPLNVKSKGVLPVAVLGMEDFDVTEVDVDYISLAGVAPIRFDYEDVATPFDGERCDCHEAGPDGILDLVLHFDTKEIVEAIGPVVDGDELELILTSELYDGTPIEGSDCIRVIKKDRD